MSDFSLCVWSRDRASQLDLLLSSIKKFCPNQFDISVLYTYSILNFKAGYERCQRYHPSVEFIKETNFCEQTKEILNRKDYTCVCTDDTVCTNSFVLTKEMMKDVGVFSLRLGLNTLIQEPFSGRIQPALTKYVEENDTICWDSRDYHPLENYGFLTGHDGCVYTNQYKNIVQDLEFSKTNQLETLLFNERHRMNPYIRSFRKSCFVNLPSNNQSGITLADNSLPLEETNKKFIEGKRFRLDEVEKMKVVGCHQTCNLTII